MKFRHRRVEELEEGESYYVSMTDMMVGVVFIFIIMLSYFALQYRQTTVSLTRTQAPERPQTNAAAVQGEPQMAFPADEMFEPGAALLTDKGQETAEGLATTLAARLGCADTKTRTPDCDTVPRITAVVIVVRTLVDSTTGEGRDALILSQERAQAFYDAVVAQQPSLAAATAPSGVPVLQATSGTSEVRGRKSVSRLTIRFYGAHGAG